MQLPPAPRRSARIGGAQADRGLLPAEGERSVVRLRYHGGRLLASSAAARTAAWPSSGSSRLEGSHRRDQTAQRRSADQARSARCRSSRTRSSSPLNPPAIPELGNSSGFDFRLQDRGRSGPRQADGKRATRLLGHGRAESGPQGVRPEGLERRTAAADRHRPRIRRGRWA